MRALTFILLLPCLSFAIGIRSDRGGMDSTGGDIRSEDRGAAWFLRGTNKSIPITFCIEASANFGRDIPELKSLVEFAFKKWENYMQVKRVNLNSDLLPIPSEDQIETNLSFQARCTRETELKFYFGQENSFIKKIQEKYERPIAFSERLSYDPSVGRAKGIVWIINPNLQDTSIPNWNIDVNLKAILLHEVGHVLGCEHKMGTIMDRDIHRYFFSTQEDLDDGVPELSEYSRRRLTSIDHSAEVHFCESCQFNYEGFPFPTTTEEVRPKLIKQLTGVDFKNFVRSRLSKIQEKRPEQKYQVNLLIEDGEQAKTLTIEFDRLKRTTIPNELSSFLRYRMFTDDIGNITFDYMKKTYGTSISGEISYGKMMGADGKTYIIVMERNLSSMARIMTMPSPNETLEDSGWPVTDRKPGNMAVLRSLRKEYIYREVPLVLYLFNGAEKIKLFDQFFVSSASDNSGYTPPATPTPGVTPTPTPGVTPPAIVTPTPYPDPTGVVLN